MRVVVAVGGSVLAPQLGAARVQAHAEAIGQIVDAGWSVGAVVGGGTTAREYIETARAIGANEIELDELGVQATRLNARLLGAALGELAPAKPAQRYDDARDALRREDVAVMGGVTAGQTTDAVAAALAEYTESDLLVYATSVPGVFTGDPETTEDAERYDRLSATELVDVIADLEMSAGSGAPVDLLAAKLIQRSGVRTIVLDGTEPERIARAVNTGDHDGTDVVPAGEDGTLDAWSG